MMISFFIPTREHLACTSRGQRKSRPFGRQFSILFRFGGILFRSSNLFRTKWLKLSPGARACKHALRPARKNRPLNYLMNFPPPIFYFLAERAGFSGGSPTASGGGAGVKAAQPPRSALEAQPSTNVKKYRFTVADRCDDGSTKTY